jgi:hypothetical protein
MDGDGVLSFQEFKKKYIYIYIYLYIYVHTHIFMYLYTYIGDTDGDGVLSFQEFKDIFVEVAPDWHERRIMYVICTCIYITLYTYM